MSGFGSSGFGGGFGQSNNQQPGGFGFGTNTNNASAGFGSNTSNTFGSGNTSNGTGLFGNNSNAGGFGSSSGAFGSTSNNAFGATKPAFGSTTTTPSGGGLFGSSNTNTGTSAFGSGGFGNTSNNNTSSPFGGASGGLFSANKPAFGTAGNTGTTSLFGSNTSGGFGGTVSGAFGAANNPGLGGAVGDPPGTNIAPFQAHIEKEPNSTTNQSNSFQNILFQEPYKKWSAEELRLQDYAQGRKHGNASGAGAFGVSSGFGSGFGTNNNQSSSFGNTSSGSTLFGSSNTNTTSTFGQAAPGGFGGGAPSSGLFGSKPATGGGLFGNTSQPTQTATGMFGSGPGGFGSSANTGSAFGSNTTANAGGGAFGAAANNTQNKPASGFNFGQGATNSGFGNTGATGGAFGATNTTANTGPSMFGNTGQTASGGLFGNANTQQQAAGNTFGTGAFGTQNQQSGTSLFGNNAQQKPAGGGLFGGGNTSSGGLFGNTQATTTPFGGNSTAAPTGGLFGQKAPAAGAGLFGSSTAGQTTGNTGGLFGGLGANAQTQQPTQTLFSSMGQSQPKHPSLFGTSTQAAGGGVFGNQNMQPQSSLFGQSAVQQQPAMSLLGGSILGGSQGIGQAPHSLTASIADVSAYGTPSLFSNLGGNETPNPGPLATPLGGKTKPRRSSILPMYKLNPASASRFMTPQKRGFGFSYSTYGTPGSPSSVSSTPGGFGRSLLGASNTGRGLSKSVSTSSLRRNFNTEDSILAPGAFSASSGSRFYGSSGSVKKLVINRDMRSDLFSTPTKEKPAIESANGSRKLSKRVSFDTSTVESTEGSGEELSQGMHEPPDLQSLGSRSANGAKALTNLSSIDADQSKGKELAIVHEEDPMSQNSQLVSTDKAPGGYWMEPSRAELDALNRTQLQKVSGFAVGRENVGCVSFKVPVDLTNIKLDDLFGGIVNLQTRAATVYPDPSKKPPVGKGLNVPATISLEQSWPRVRDQKSAKDPKRLFKHIERLKRIENTVFESYDKETGVWTFSVEHFTTYGLDYEDDETDIERPATIDDDNVTPSQQPKVMDDDNTFNPSPPDDTFEFRRRNNVLPGSFDQQDPVGDHDDDDSDMVEPAQVGYAFPGGRQIAPAYMDALGRGYSREDEDVLADGELPDGDAIPTSFAHDGISLQDRPDDDVAPSAEIPGGILRARTRALKGLEAPTLLNLPEQNPWRESIRESLDRRVVASQEEEVPTDGSSKEGVVQSETRGGFSTSMDLMNSIFGKDGGSTQSLRTPVLARSHFKFPLNRHGLTADLDNAGANQQTREGSMRASWGRNGILVFATDAGVAMRPTTAAMDMLSVQSGVVRGGVRDVRFGKLSTRTSGSKLHNQMLSTDIRLQDEIPVAELRRVPLETLFHGQEANGPAGIQEKQIWQLASILFDPVTVQAGETESSVRKTNLSLFWEDLVSGTTVKSVALAKSSEEKALASLAGRKKAEACKHLLDGKDYRTATLVALIGSNEESKKSMRVQLKQWRDGHVLSEFSEPMRAIYELLGGNVCVSEGKKNAPVEDRMDSFVISKHFGFDWRQSFGLRLWYGAAPQDDISVAVKMFAEDIEQDKESRPIPWYAEQKIQPQWEDGRKDERENLLWGLLKLYAEKRLDLEAILLPENSQLSPLDFRLSWQLSQALLSTGQSPYLPPAQQKLDAMTMSFASQLMADGSQDKAAWVLLHLTDKESRSRALRDHLARNWFASASLIGCADVSEGSDMPAGFRIGALLKDLAIPRIWLHEAMALWCRNQAEQTSDSNLRLKFKVNEAHVLWQDGRTRRDAHLIFAQDIAPSFIVKRAYSELLRLVAWVKQVEGRERGGPDWMQGGGVYVSFANIIGSSKTGRPIQQSDSDLLLTGLPVLNTSSVFQSELCQAAVTEMAVVVTRLVSHSSHRRQGGVSVGSLTSGLMMTSDSRRVGAVGFSGRAMM